MIPALVGETLFRGYLQRRFPKRWSPAVAISVSTLPFALMHMDSLEHIIAIVPLRLLSDSRLASSTRLIPGRGAASDRRVAQQLELCCLGHPGTSAAAGFVTREEDRL